MAVFWDKRTKRMYPVNDGYDNDDFVINDSVGQRNQWQNMERTDLHNSSGWNENHFSTKVDEFRDFTALPKRLKSDSHKRMGFRRSNRNW